MLELIKNSWDADADKVTVEVRTKGTRKIIVDDTGTGMSREDFDARWLVIGASHKRTERTTPGGRPLIGEKGLGRLATFALGRTIRIASSPGRGQGFKARIDWGRLLESTSLEQYPIDVSSSDRTRGTRVEIRDLAQDWSSKHSDYLVSHTEFLTAIPGAQFEVTILIDGKRQRLARSTSQVARLAEAALELVVGKDGTPSIRSCTVDGVDYSGVQFRDMDSRQLDRRLAGTTLKLLFFRRDEVLRKLGDTLQRNLVTGVLERYQGVRIYRSGINVPPYGINGDDWAALEKQRTSKGGPTMVPGNSQLVGELHVNREQHAHLVITAGRSGFADQQAVGTLADYTRWAVRCIGTARRAKKLGLVQGRVPSRVDTDDGGVIRPKPQGVVEEAFQKVEAHQSVQEDLGLKKLIREAAQRLLSALEEDQETLHLYAQLASTGIAATSFSHELRTDFDVITEVVGELVASAKKGDRELREALSSSWARVRSFAALFQVVPVKLRRRARLMAPEEIEKAAMTASELATPEKIHSTISAPSKATRLVPADLDSILINLVSNAVKAINASSNRDAGRLLISFRDKGANLEIRVADNGCGLTAKVRRVMFEPLEGAFSEGTGMGLPIVQFLAGRYGGTVSVSPTPPSGYVTEIVAVLRDVISGVR